MKDELPKRKSMRLQGFDYSSTGAYFITICTHNRQNILSDIVKAIHADVQVSAQNNVGTGVPDGPQTIIELTEYGRIADKYIKRLNDFYGDLSVENYVIMPNHIHMLILVGRDGPSRTPVPTVQNSTISRFISTFKRFCNKEYGKNIWQYRSNDHIIRDREDYDRHVRYICENPQNWIYDELYGE